MSIKREKKEDILKFLDAQIVKKYGTQENFKETVESRSYDKTIYKKIVELKKSNDMNEIFVSRTIK